MSKPGQNYFCSDRDDLHNEVLANGSIWSEIFFPPVTVFIKLNKTTLWQLYISAIFIFNINDDAKI